MSTLPDEGISDVTSALSIDPLFSVVQLQVHVAVESDELALVFHPPLHLYDDWLVNQVDEEGLRVHWYRLYSLSNLKAYLGRCHL